MRAKVVRPFYDLERPDRSYNVGDSFEGTEARVAGLAAKGFVEAPPKPSRRRAAKAKE